MSRCRFQKGDPGTIRCRDCGRSLKAPPRRKQIDETCAEGDERIGPHDGALCVNRGPSRGFRPCDECGHRGNRQEVYVCAVYELCSDREGVRAAKSCRWCRDFSPKPSP